MKRLLALAMAATLATAARQAPYKFSVTDVPANRTLVLRFENLTSRTLCLSANSWPDEEGIVPASSDRISVTVDAREYPLGAPFIDPPPLYGAKVKPRQIITTHFNYRSFNIPASLIAEPKVLQLTPTIVRCN